MAEGIAFDFTEFPPGISDLTLNEGRGIVESDGDMGGQGRGTIIGFVRFISRRYLFQV